MAFRRVLTVVAVLGLGALVYGQQIKTVPPSRTSPASGAEMFKAYCAVCHGVDGTGNGPAAPALKKQPANLTQLKAKNNGKFPELHVYNVIDGDPAMPAHGTRDMPMWGTVFRSMNQSDQSETKLRLRNLTAYIESLQK